MVYDRTMVNKNTLGELVAFIRGHNVHIEVKAHRNVGCQPHSETGTFHV